MHLISTRARATLDPAVGHIPTLVLDGVDVLHRAPWRDDPAVQVDRSLPMVDRRLGGTFFCAPFGLDDVHGGPPHGAPANTRWLVKRHTPEAARLRLAMNVQGARLDHHVVLREGHPVLYQTHVFTGGTGPMTVAHHPMLHLARGGRLRCSPKRRVYTEPAPLEPGADYWPRKAHAQGWQFPGGLDPRDYPDVRCEEFCTMIEAPGAPLGWSAVERFAEGDTILILRDPRVMPVTMLWVSNGGRGASPWNGRHTGVLGIEDGMTGGGAGFADAVARGQTLDLGAGPHVLRHAIARLAMPVTVADVVMSPGGLQVTGEDGRTHTLPFDTEFFA